MEQDQSGAVEALKVHVNGQSVRLQGREHTGLQIKEAAIAQEVPIKLSFVLYEEVGHDQTKHVKDDELISVSDTTRFLADEAVIVIRVNEQPVSLDGVRHTGLQIKQAAIAQNVRIQIDFVLLEELAHHRTKEVKDSETVRVTSKSEFQAIPNDDHS